MDDLVSHVQGDVRVLVSVAEAFDGRKPRAITIRKATDTEYAVRVEYARDEYPAEFSVHLDADTQPG